MKNLVYFLFSGLICSALFLGSCEQYVIPLPEIEPGDSVSYSLDIQPVWDSKCITCHNGNRDPDLRPDVSHGSLVNGGYINVDNPGESELMKKLNGTHDSRATTAEKQQILLWITEGANDN